MRSYAILTLLGGVLVLASCGSGEEPAPEAPGMPGAPAAERKLPASALGLPVAPGFMITSWDGRGDGAGGVLRLEGDGRQSAALAFYRRELASLGWRETDASLELPLAGAAASASKGAPMSVEFQQQDGQRLVLRMRELESGATELWLILSASP